MEVRKETREDYCEIEELIKRAFQFAEHSDKNEHKLVAKIREGENYIPDLALVAVGDGKVLGYVMLSKIEIKSQEKIFPALALAPVCVMPEYQKQGIGKELIREAMTKAEKFKYYTSVVVLGDPYYYMQFGFKKAKEFGVYAKIPGSEDYLMIQELSGNDLHGISGEVVYGPEFGLGD